MISGARARLGNRGAVPRSGGRKPGQRHTQGAHTNTRRWRPSDRTASEQLQAFPSDETKDNQTGSALEASSGGESRLELEVLEQALL